MALWRIMHRLFDWDYVYVSNGADDRVCRIWYRGGTPMVSPYSFQHWELRPPYHGWSVTPLTPRAAEIVEATR